MSQISAEQQPSAEQLKEFVGAVISLRAFCVPLDADNVMLVPRMIPDKRTATVTMPAEAEVAAVPGDYELITTDVGINNSREVMAEFSYWVSVTPEAEGTRYDQFDVEEYYKKNEDEDWEPIRSPLSEAWGRARELRAEGKFEEAEEVRLLGVVLFVKYIEMKRLLGLTKLEQYLAAMTILHQLQDDFGIVVQEYT